MREQGTPLSPPTDNAVGHQAGDLTAEDLAEIDQHFHITHVGAPGGRDPLAEADALRCMGAL